MSAAQDIRWKQRFSNVQLAGLPTPCLFDVTHYDSLRHPDTAKHAPAPR